MKYKLILLILSLFIQNSLFSGIQSPEVRDSVVLINCTAQGYRFDTPWKKTGIQKGMGTGFVVDTHEGKAILTNAHVVSNAIYLEIMRVEDDQRYVARVKHIAHDCDLALLTVDDSEFFKTMPPLTFGGLPEINSTVSTYGFPMGGTQLSVTKGVVSRIQQWTYAHSGSDAHLVIQTDAAINPGNSGGPVLQNNKVVGVAFQGMTRGDNIGYMIPSLVVDHFLKDVRDGNVDGFGEIGVSYRLDLQNPMVRKLLKVPEKESGAVITRVFPDMPGWGVLKPLDVLLEIEGLSIGDDGFVKLDGRYVDFPEVMERLQVGEKVKFKIWRDGKYQNIELTLKLWDLVIPHNRPYDIAPKYYIYSGLCFTPLSRGYFETGGGWKKSPLAVRWLYLQAFGDPKLVHHEEFPVLCQKLPDEINQGSENYIGQVVEKINGQKVTSMKELKDAFNGNKSPYINIEFYGNKVPLVLSAEKAKEKDTLILMKYRIPKGERL